MNRIIEALTTLRNALTDATTVFDTKRKYCHENYANKLATEKLNEAKEEYESVVSSSKAACKEECEKVFSEYREKIVKKASEPADPDFLYTLSILKDLKTLDLDEIKLIAGNFSTNYTSYRATCDTVGSSIEGYKSIKLTDITSVLDDIKSKISRTIADGNPDSYSFRYYEHTDYLSDVESLCRAFIEGDFEKAALLI